ncbi:hypothetical protein AAFC00_003758 [Neodothiora populina]|uniref:ferric-chelate reductase (NADPH) n=1 Tax=Neodothiora populina TaxID=2781224 RepID=A0ABR3PFA7_9PEZI
MDMDQGGMDMSMGSMSSGKGVPSYFAMEQMYWAVVGAAIGAFTLTNVYGWLLYMQRIRAIDQTPAKPKSLPFVAMASATAILRELGNVSLPLLSIKSWRIPSPTLGRTSIVLGNLITLLVLSFYKLDISDRWSYESIGYRTGFINVCQLPLLFLLAGKRNIIGYLTGTSYERINWLHRWASRCLLLTATIHMGYWFADWAPFDYIGTKIRTDDITKHGVAAWAILVWIVFSSMTPIRGWCYEFFVFQHIVSFAAFIGMVYLHVPIEVRYWIWICVGFFFFDRFVRGCFYLYNNLSLLHPKQRREGTMGSFWALKAEFTALSNDVVKVNIRDPPISWTPGQHVFLTCQALAPLQAHPFTIASLPVDGQMSFLIQAKGGSTKKLLRHAGRVELSLPQSNRDIARQSAKSVAIEGPYGRIRPLKQFDSVVLLAGSTGASFTMPLVRDLIESWKTWSKASKSSRNRVVTRRIRYVWIVKSGKQLDWFAQELRQVIEDVQTLQSEGHDIEVEISAYITCDETFTTEQKSILEALHSSSSPKAPAQREHGSIDVLPTPEETEYPNDNKKDLYKKDMIEEREVYEPSINSDANAGPSNPSCGPNGTCCCTATIEDEDADDAIRPACTCNCGAGAGPSTTESSAASSIISFDEKSKPKPKQPLLHSAINIFSGRPACRNLIRKSLEQAHGESAVVVCGPAGLVDDVRVSTVSLSDERAVHKGTGAQGIWLHTEAFGY